MQKQLIKQSEYEDIYDCIVSDQVPHEDVAQYLEDKNFYRYYIKRRTLGGLWKRKND